MWQNKNKIDGMNIGHTIHRIAYDDWCEVKNNNIKEYF